MTFGLIVARIPDAGLAVNERRKPRYSEHVVDHNM